MANTIIERNIRRPIEFRKTLDASIFDEMSEKYPKNSDSRIEYKQETSFLSLPTDEKLFNIPEILYDAKDAGMNGYEVLSVLILIVRAACLDFGYYSVYDRVYRDKISMQSQLPNNKVEEIVSYLISVGLVYIFGERIVNVYSVRTYETVQSTRAANRKAKANERASKSKTKRKNKTAPKILPNMNSTIIVDMETGDVSNF